MTDTTPAEAAVGHLPAQFIVTIDGPAGAGKTSVSRKLAEKIGFDYIDTGALYRGVAHAALAGGVDIADNRALAELCAQITVELNRHGDGALRLWVSGQDVTDEIRTPEVTMAASAASAKPAVRDYLLTLQRNLGRGRRAVFEGRDMGTVVFPEADIKFFMTAALEIRAGRRHQELKGQFDLPLEKVRRDMARRDADDSQRTLAPLKAAADAIVIDTGRLSLDAVVARLAAEIGKKLTGD